MNETAASTVCFECGYNLPHHGAGCPLRPATVALCPAHAHGTEVRSDDGKFTCSVCGTNGYHVGLFLR